MKKPKKLLVFVLAATTMISTFTMPAAASTTDANFSLTIASNSTGSSPQRKKDNTSSVYVNYTNLVNGSAASGPYQFVATVYGAKSSTGTYTDCTTKINGTNTTRRTALITKNTKGFIRQDVYEKYGSTAYAKLYGTKYSNGGTGTAKGKWSADSVYESGCTDYN